MVRGRGKWPTRKKIKIRETNERGERKKEENYTKKGKKAYFWAFCLPQTYLSGEKIESRKRGVGNDQNAQYISLHSF